MSKSTSALISPAPASRNAATLELLRGKTMIIGGIQDSSATLQGTIIEVDERFCPEGVRAVMKKVIPQSSPGPSGSRLSHRAERRTR